MKSSHSLSPWMLFAIVLLSPIVSTAISPAHGEQLEVFLPAGHYRILAAEDRGQQVQMDGFGQLLVPGKPQLPARAYSIALPPGARVISVELQPRPAELIPGQYHIPPVAPSLPLADDPQLAAQSIARWEQARRSCYGSDDLYPPQPAIALQEGRLRRYRFLRVAYFPLALRPRSGQLWFTPGVAVRVHYELGQMSPQESALENDLAAEQTASWLLANYAQAVSWYPPLRTAKSLADYVVIAPASLAPAMAPLVEWKQTIGRAVQVVTTSWIDSAYAGDDLPQKIRSFLGDKYPQGQWGIRDVLIAAGIDSIPMRTCHVDPPSHANPTPSDYYYAELSQPDSLSWDSDGDGYYGEYLEDQIDFAAEVWVGRIPHSDTAKVRQVCRQLVDFERDTGSWKKRALLLGAISNFQNEDRTGWPRTDGAALMEVVKDSLLAGWMVTRMYEESGLEPSSYAHEWPLTQENVHGQWGSGRYALVNWNCHGSSWGAYRKYWASDDGDGVPESAEMISTAFIDLGTAQHLDDDFPSICFAASCSNGKPEGLFLAKSLLANGSAGVVAATRLAWYNCGWQWPDDGGVASLDYHFCRYLFAQGQAVGQALYDSKIYYHDYLFEAYPGDDIWSPQQNLLGLTLYGDPALIHQGVDVAPPAAVADLVATLADSAISLEWSAVSQDIHGNEEIVSHYVIYRDSLPDYSSTNYDSIGYTVAPGYIDNGCGAGQAGSDYFYLIKAADPLGHQSAASPRVGYFDRRLNRE